MFGSMGFGKELDETIFEEWLEKGRNQLVGYKIMAISWETIEEEFQHNYFFDKDQLNDFVHEQGTSVFIAAYDLYSESRLLVS